MRLPDYAERSQDPTLAESRPASRTFRGIGAGTDRGADEEVIASTSSGASEAPELGGAAIPTLAIEQWTYRNLGTLADAEAVIQALEGRSDLGELSTPEQRHLIGKALDRWLASDDYSSIARLASEASSNVGMARLVSERYARRALELPHGLKHRNQAAALADGAMFALIQDPAGKRALIDQLGSRAPDLIDALAVGERFMRTDQHHRVLVLGQMLEGANVGEPSEATQAFLNRALESLPMETYSREWGPNAEMMASALASHWYSNDPELEFQEASRFAGILASEQGASLIASASVPREARQAALGLLREHPEWSAQMIAEGEGWADPAIAGELAEPRASEFLELRGDSPQTMTGRHLDNTVGFAMGFPVDPILGSVDAHETAVARGERSNYASQPAVKAVGDQIRAVGGQEPKVTVLPLQYSSPDTGPVQLPLFRVHGTDGRERYVDNAGARYDSFEHWVGTNGLPPGNMTYPSKGHLTSDGAGGARLTSGNTPKTVDSAGEYAMSALDNAALVGGVFAGGAVLVGSGGTAVLLMGAGASAWAGYRAAGSLHDRSSHGLSIDPRESAEARQAWLDMGASVLDVSSLGAASLAKHGTKSMQALARVSAGALHTGSFAMDSAAAGNAGYSLITQWEELTPTQRAELGMSMAFWGASMGASAKLRSADLDARPADPRANGAVTEMADPYARRETVGWSGTPTRTPNAGETHLGFIQRGIEQVGAMRGRLDLLLGYAEQGPRGLALERDDLGARQAELYGELGKLQGKPSLTPEQQRQKSQIEAEIETNQQQRDDLEARIGPQRETARNAALSEMRHLQESLMGARTPEAARALTARMKLEPSATQHESQEVIERWSSAFFQLMPRNIRPERIRLVTTDKRAHANPDGELNLGAKPNRAVVFHELGHFIEFEDAAVGRAAKSWVEARSRQSNGTLVAKPMQELDPKGEYRPDEVALTDHFVHPYVGKQYPTPMSEVVTVGLEFFTTPEDMLKLYQQDPEHFFFMLGLLNR